MPSPVFRVFSVTSVHEAQLLSYLKLSNIRLGLMIIPAVLLLHPVQDTMSHFCKWTSVHKKTRG